MLELLSLLLILACPLGMAAMMAGPTLIRKFTRPHAAADVGGGTDRGGAG